MNRLFAVLLAITALACARAVSAPVDYTATVSPQNVLVENFEGWGTSLCWWAHVLGGSSNREAYADLAFKKLQLNIVRYNIGGGENPAITNTMEVRARMPGFEPRPGVWDWTADANQRWFLRAAVARGADRIEAFANSPPYWMTVSGSVTGTTNGIANNVRVDCEKTFAEYLSTVVSNITVLDGVKFNTITPMNEPGSEWWRHGGRQEGTYMSHEQQVRMIQLLRPALDRCGLSTGIIASEDNDEQRTIDALASYPQPARQLLSHIATHTYTANNPSGLHQLAITFGRPLWVTEYGDDEASGLTMARRIRDDIVQLHASAWIYWQFAEPDSDWGLVSYRWDDARRKILINKKFYVLSQFSCFIRPGFKILDSGDDNSLAAYDPAAHRLVIVAVNDGRRPLTVAYDINSFHFSNPPVTRTRTSRAENMKAVESPTVTGGKFISTLPPHSVTTHVIQGVETAMEPK